jgi:RHS repeat-associated protein
MCSSAASASPRRDNPSSPSATVAYYFSDHLKTASVITDSSGNIKSDSDYYPWGGELEFIANDSNHYKFTGKERDTETNLDYFGARYYANVLGRFITPDWAAKATAVPYGDFADPQSLNLYSYVRNLPSTRLDLDGHDFASAWQKVKDAVSQISIKVTIGLGIGAKTKAYGGVSARAEGAVKANLEFSGSEGRLKVSQSLEAGVSVGTKKGQVGLAGSVEQVKLSVDVRNGEVHGPEAPTTEKVVGVSKEDKSASAGSDKVTLFGSEAGRGPLGGGELSITNEGLQDLKAAYNDLKETLFPSAPAPAPAPTPPPQEQPASHN